VFDDRIHEAAMEFEDYRQAHASGAVLHAQTLDALAQAMQVPSATLNDTVVEVSALAQDAGTDGFGRTFKTDERLVPSYRAIRVTGALFHTQGGLAVDQHARVIGEDGQPIVGLYAGGGAARGVSGSGDSGYLSGNGLLAAVMLGATAGESAAAQVLQGST
jgi:fumarate reductase flavoprotein subunit